MPGVSGSISSKMVGKRSFLRGPHLVRWIFPLAADDDFYVTTVDPSGVAAGAALTLTTNGALLTAEARQVVVKITDASYSAAAALSVVIRVVGYRFGIRREEDISATATSGSAFTANSTYMYDQIESMTLISKTAASGDDLKIGFTDTCLGLPFRISSTNAVKFIRKINTASSNARTNVVVSSTTVDLTNHAIKGLTTVIATDIYEALVENNGPDGWGSGGSLA